MSALPPGPKGRLIVGSFNTYDRDKLAFLLNASREYGDLAYTHFFGQPFALVNHPDEVHLILVGEPDRFEKVTRRAGRDPHTNLSDSTGELWRARRKLVAPAFHGQRVLAYGEVMTASARALAESWRAGETVDLNETVAAAVLRVVTKTLLNADFTDMTAMIASLMDKAQAFMVKRTTQPIGALLDLVMRERRSIGDYIRLRESFTALVRERRAAGSPDMGDLLSMLMLARTETGGALDDGEVGDEAFGLFIAGYETTATGLVWMLWLLAQHPDVLARVRAEVEALGGRDATAHDDLPYCDQVVRESLRLYPPAWVMVRRFAPGGAMPIRGYTLPANTIFALSPYAMQRDPRWFPDPERFDPDRFTETAVKARPRMVYFPFGSGPRVCIGNSFALLEMRLFLAALARRVTLGIPPDAPPVTPNPLITLRPSGPVRVTIDRMT